METIMRATLCEIETLLVPLPEPIAALESLFASPLDLRVFLGELSQRCICCGSAPVIAPTNLELLQARGFGADFTPRLLRLAALVIILSLETLRLRTVPEVVGDLRHASSEEIKDLLRDLYERDILAFQHLILDAPELVVKLQGELSQAWWRNEILSLLRNLNNANERAPAAEGPNLPRWSEALQSLRQKLLDFEETHVPDLSKRLMRAAVGLEPAWMLFLKRQATGLERTDNIIFGSRASGWSDALSQTALSIFSRLFLEKHDPVNFATQFLTNVAKLDVSSS
ncbi:hypothetical protein EBZ37_10475 [bacterium]|nr:hypothetical protein [bacterium]